MIAQLSTKTDTIHFLKGDYIIYTGQPTNRYIIETLEPLGDDSFLKWNFFDAILQQKEWYIIFRWEDVAAQYLQQHPQLKQRLGYRLQLYTFMELETVPKKYLL